MMNPDCTVNLKLLVLIVLAGLVYGFCTGHLVVFPNGIPF
jgi:hypothetical protein